MELGITGSKDVLKSLNIRVIMMKENKSLGRIQSQSEYDRRVIQERWDVLGFVEGLILRVSRRDHYCFLLEKYRMSRLSGFRL